MTYQSKLRQLLAGDQGDELVEKIIQHIYSQWVKSGDFVIDGGSADGRHTLPLANLVGPAGLVLAVEPLYSLTYKHRPWAKNYLADCVIIEEVALSNFIGTTTFNCINSNPGFSGLKNGYWSADAIAEQINVTAITIDQLINTHKLDIDDKWLSFIKLDLEGGEYNALVGAQSALAKYHPLVIFEHARNAAPVNYDYHPSKIFELANQNGYFIFDILGEKYAQSDDFNDNTPHYLALIPKSENHIDIFKDSVRSLDKLLS